ncbi:hypothetical protein QFC20_004738 [Naganishia adeliensis]|uniref:Uncharacterized protein n=1 Tax=Naganishia adeliensis TaxID=92952 RepID=A0ACC2VW74_9TREE|nr:hypothetical protein QFC20_004738 [Naganishia adeliensis]
MESPRRKVDVRKKFEFEMWVEIEGETTQLNGMHAAVRGSAEAWFMSEHGKDETAHTPYPDMYLGCYIDGVWVGTKLLRESQMTPSAASTNSFNGRRISTTEERKSRFTAPTLTEERTRSIDASQAGLLSIQIKRCKRGYENFDTSGDLRRTATSVAGPMNEKFTKKALLSAVTEDGETDKAVWKWKCHPIENRTPFFEMRLRYAPEAVLMARNIIPNKLQPNIAEGQPGLLADDAIVLEDSDDEGAGSASAPRDVVLKVEPHVNGNDSEARPDGSNEASNAAIAASEVSLVGVGRPFLSPTPYDALCMGVPLINPILSWDMKGPDDRTKWNLQHGGLSDLGEPYVYNVRRGNETEMKDTIAKAVATPIEPFVSRRMTRAAVHARYRLLVETVWKAVYDEKFGQKGV